MEDGDAHERASATEGLGGALGIAVSKNFIMPHLRVMADAEVRAYMMAFLAAASGAAAGRIGHAALADILDALRQIALVKAAEQQRAAVTVPAPPALQ